MKLTFARIHCEKDYLWRIHSAILYHLLSSLRLLGDLATLPKFDDFVEGFAGTVSVRAEHIVLHLTSHAKPPGSGRRNLPAGQRRTDVKRSESIRSYPRHGAVTFSL